MLQKDCGRRDNSGSVESYPYILELRDHTLPLPAIIYTTYMQEQHSVPGLCSSSHDPAQ